MLHKVQHSAKSALNCEHAHTLPCSPCWLTSKWSFSSLRPFAFTLGNYSSTTSGYQQGCWGILCHLLGAQCEYLLIVSLATNRHVPVGCCGSCVSLWVVFSLLHEPHWTLHPAVIQIYDVFIDAFKSKVWSSVYQFFATLWLLCW